MQMIAVADSMGKPQFGQFLGAPSSLSRILFLNKSGIESLGAFTCSGSAFLTGGGTALAGGFGFDSIFGIEIAASHLEHFISSPAKLSSAS